ncbi:zeta toxin family protein [Arthrobacter citreus]|uniref:UDP-N-acetylglucosamine kinase n=1 Tax=Arthrobacter citreus TaxID=1670 RepID=A0ABZ2ZZ92_9MICC
MGLAGIAIFVNGTVGAGKTATADALGDLLRRRQIPHAVIDLDRLRQAWPPAEGDPFNHGLELANLKAMASNYLAAGMTTLVIAGVIEQKAAVAQYTEALDQWQLFIVRLTAEEAVRRNRIEERHIADPAGREWHLRRTLELETILEAARLENAVIDTSVCSPSEVAQRVLEAVMADRPQ